MPKSKSSTTLQRYALTGLALGLYFGFFFRPLREPSFSYMLGLAVVVAVVMTGLSIWREGLSFRQWLPRLALNYVRAAALLLMLEGRHLVYGWGGRMAVTVYAGILGLGAGLAYAWQQNR